MERLLRDNLLGAILVSRGIISEEQLELALQVQEREQGRRKLGDILQDLGYVSGEGLRQAVATQQSMSEEVIGRLETPHPAWPRPDPGRDRLLIYFQDQDEGARWTRLLWDEGYILDLAPSAESILQRLQQSRYSLLLIEIDSPEALRIPPIARRLDPDLITVAVVDYAFFRTSWRNLWSVTPYYLLRPFERSELLLILGEALARRHLHLENQTLRAQVKRHEGEMALLVELGRLLLLAEDLTQALNLVMCWLMDIFDSQAGALLLVDQQSRKLRLEVVVGEQSAAMRPLLLKLGQGAYRWVAQKREPMLVPNLFQDPHFRAQWELPADYKSCSVFCMPLQVLEKTVGLIELTRTDGTPFTPWDQGLLMAIATMIGYAVVRPRMYQVPREGHEEKPSAPGPELSEQG